MKLIRAKDEVGQTIPEPFKRHIKVLFAPDKNDVPELTFSFALIYPRSKTDYHEHDRPELIYVVTGYGLSICEDKETEVGPDTVMWIPAGEKHQMVNQSDETMKLATVFIPGYTAEENYARCQQAAKKGQ